MITMNELVDLRMQQQLAHEIYRQQIMQRIPDPFPPMLPLGMPRHVLMPPRVTLPGVQVTLQNDELWQQFHQIGTEMIITKSGRRMFPSMRLTLSGLEDDANYCVLLEMVPMGDCRFKFSGSQWVPAGGAEPQSPQRMYLHPDSPASGSHFQAQPILFNKVKLTNNTLDSSGHIVLASMHKYQPRIHVIRTSDLTQIPWAPQQAFVFPETEFVAVTAYQNDRITKLKIDNNPFAKGFRETGQSRCKRKMSLSPTGAGGASGSSNAGALDLDEPEQMTQQQQSQHAHMLMGHKQQQQQHVELSPIKSIVTIASGCATEQLIQQRQFATNHNNNCSSTDATDLGNQIIKRLRSNGSACSIASLEELNAINNNNNKNINNNSNGMPEQLTTTATTTSDSRDLSMLHEQLPPPPPPLTSRPASQSQSASTLLMQAQSAANAAAAAQLAATNSPLNVVAGTTTSAFMQHFHQNMQTLLRPSLVDLACTYFARPQALYPHQHQHPPPPPPPQAAANAAMLLNMQQQHPPSQPPPPYVGMHLLHPEYVGYATNTLSAADIDELNVDDVLIEPLQSEAKRQCHNFRSATRSPPQKKKGFSISAILGGGS